MFMSIMRANFAYAIIRKFQTMLWFSWHNYFDLEQNRALQINKI